MFGHYDWLTDLLLLFKQPIRMLDSGGVSPASPEAINTGRCLVQISSKCSTQRINLLELLENNLGTLVDLTLKYGK